MTRGAADIRREAAREKAVLFEKGARQMVKGRCEATIALAELERSRGYFDLGFESVQKLAAALSALEPREVSEMLWVGRKLLQIPELKNAFMDGRLSWTAVRALVPHITAANATEWIAKATGKSAGRLEREISNQRNRCIGGGPTKPLFLSLPGYQRFEQMANGLRKEAGEKHLPDEECLMQLFDEVDAAREVKRMARVRASGAATRTRAPVAAAPDELTPPPAVETVVPVAKCATRSRHIPAAIRRQVMNRARHACEICRNRHGLEVHHKKRFSEDGPHTLENLMAVCH